MVKNGCDGPSAQIIPIKLYCPYGAKNDLQGHISKNGSTVAYMGKGDAGNKRSSGFSVIHLLYA
jgi:hypothetical protein